MSYRFTILFLFFVLLTCRLTAQILWLDDIKVDLMEAGWGTSRSNTSVEGKKLSVGGQTFARGIGTHAVSRILFNLYGQGVRFMARVGVDDEAGQQATVEFVVLGDKKVLWRSGVMKKGNPAKEVSVSLKDIEKLGLLVTDGGDNIDYDHADWLEAKIEYKDKSPTVFMRPTQKPITLTPATSEFPKINYPRITGCQPGKPFLFTVPATGKPPLSFSATDLPAGLILDQETGIIRGTIIKEGIYKVDVIVSNGLGKVSETLRIVAGEKLALTPPMGWNSWNCWGLSVDENKVRAAANAFVKKGLRGHGWTYINIDDGWEAPKRDKEGRISANEKFPDMKKLCDDVHHQGLKIGIYSSPGETTCGGFLGSLNHEAQDARTWADWGIDYLKYDWCSYSKQAKDRSISELKKPYITMRDALHQVDRDIVYSLCQYGMGGVWEWGASVDGNLWRTTGDITDTWKSMAGIGFSQGECSPYAKPGRWNDPDMLVVGQLGWGPELRKTQLTPDEQYTHISLWSLLSAPLLLGCELEQIDDFTLNLLTNDEVIAINQDPMGEQARRISAPGENEIWVKHLEGGSLAVGFFFTRQEADKEVAEFQWEDNVLPAKMKINWAQLNISGPYKIRDLWQQKDLGVFNEKFETEVPWHGCKLIKISRL